MRTSVPSVDLRPDHWAIVRRALRRHVPDREVLAFGSRATWTAKDYSDLDLAVMGEEPLSLRTVSALDEALGDSDLPFKVDVVDWARIDDAFRSVIRRHGVSVQDPTGSFWAPAPTRGSPRQPRNSSAASKWASINLGRACTKIGSGATPRGGKDVYLPGGPYALIRSQNVFNEGFRHEGIAYIGERHAFDLAGVEVRDGDVLLNITGDSVARACQVDTRILPARVNQHVAIVRPDPRKLDPGFLRYYLVCPDTQARLLSWAGSGGTRNALTKAMIETFDVQAPEDVSEQRAIAHVLGSLDTKIELNWRMNETLEAMARALFKSWFVDFDPVRAKMEGRDTGLPQDIADLFPDRMVDSEMGEIPEGWKAASLGTVIEIHDKRRIPLNRRQRAERQGAYPYYGAASIMDYVNDYLFDGVYVLMGEDGSVVDAHGHPVVQYVWGKFWVNNHAHVLKGNKDISDEHLYLLLKRTNITAFVTGAVQPKLNQKNLKAIPLVVPTGPACRAFSGLVAPLFAQVRHDADESELLVALRDTLLPKLIAGEVCVGDAEKVVELVT